MPVRLEQGKRVCVFCGSSAGANGAYLRAATQLGRLLAGDGHTLIYGGGAAGLMGALANAALARGGRVIGVIPQALVKRDLAHRGLTDMRVVRDLHERKALMITLADAFVALPGGLGTLDEIAEVATQAQLELHRKPLLLLNVAAYFDGLMRLIEHAIAERFLAAEHRALITLVDEPAAAVEFLRRLPADDAPADAVECGQEEL